MLSEGKNIDQVFREKAETFNPGTAMADADWNLIKNQLPTAPGKVVPLRKRGRLFRYIAAAVAAAVVITVFLLVRPSSTPQKTIVPIAVKDTAQKIDSNSFQLVAPSLDSLDLSFNIDKWLAGLKFPLVFTPYQHVWNGHNWLPDSSKQANRPEQNTATIATVGALLADFYRDAEPVQQVYTLNARADTTITCKQGTEIYIPANTFYTGGGKPVTGAVTLTVGEYYTLGDMVAAKLNTTANGDLLKSGGMLFIKATYEEQDVYIGYRKNITVQMPARGNFDPQMQLFVPQTAAQQEPVSEQPVSVIRARNADTVSTGTPRDMRGGTGGPANGNSFQWVPVGQLQGSNNNFELEEEDPVPLIKVSTLNIIQPYSVSGNGQTATFLTGHLDKWEQDSIQRQLYRLYPQYKNIRLRSSFVGNKKFEVQGEDKLPQYIEMTGDSTFISLTYAAKNKLVSPADSARVMRKYGRSERYNTQIVRLEEKYKFSISQLGWINCDRFYNDTREKIPFVVNLGAPAADFVVRIIFPRINALSGFATAGEQTLTFPSLPLGEPVTIIAIGAINGKTVGCFKETVISKEPVTGLPFEEMDAAGFKQKTKQLN